MWDASFAGVEAGGWTGDASFQTEVKRDTKTMAIEERLPVPATISDLLSNFDEDNDRYSIGNFKFATVSTVGVVSSISSDNGSQTYVICDPDDSDKSYVAVKYSSDKSDSEHNEITEGQRVKAIGKLKGFDGTNTIMIFNLSEMPDDKEYQIFKMEAQAAKLFFKKNVIDMMKRGSIENLSGMLAPPLKKKDSAANTTNEKASSADGKERIYENKGKTEQTTKKNKEKDYIELSEKIHQSLTEIQESVGDEGAHIDWISSQVGKPEPEFLRETIAKMVDGGVIYPAASEDYYAAI